VTSYRFNEFELVPETRRLLAHGGDVALGVRVFDVVAYLIAHRDRAIGRDELLSAVWGRVDAGDATLAQAVLKARRAFGDDGTAQHFIRTVARFGYQWVAPTSEACGEAAMVPPESSLSGSQPRVAGLAGASDDDGAVMTARAAASSDRDIDRHVDRDAADIAIVANVARDSGSASMAMAAAENSHVASDASHEGDGIATIAASRRALSASRVVRDADPSHRAQRHLHRAIPITLAIAAALATALAVFHFRSNRIGVNASHTNAPAATTATIPGLILVAPTRVHSTAADDGWMRLGVMSLSATALAAAPGHAVVPDETTLAAVAKAAGEGGVDALRAATGAAVVIESEASREGEDWRIDATVFNADGSAEIVSARAGDPVAAASRLAHELRGVLAPETADDDGTRVRPEVLALTARMKSAILDAQNGRALALLEAAPRDVAAAPDVVLLQAEALTQLGKPQQAIETLRPLVDGAAVTSPPPRWLPDAWTALGDGELARGNPAQAEAYFRRAIQLDGVAGRRSIGLAWRGLGIAEIVRNDLDDAEQSYLRARLALEPVGDRLLLARITDGLGFIATARGRTADALMLYEQAAAMGAAAGLNETELGSRLNIAQAHHYLLHHAVALEKLRALLPRLDALDYPALRRFGSIAYANALIETGAFDEARDALAKLGATPPDVATDAVVDVRLDEAGIDLALGDAADAARLAEAVARDHDVASAPDLRLEAAATLLTARLALGDHKRAAALAADAGAWSLADASAPARVHAHVARAKFAASTGDAAGALDHYRQALALARTFGTPLVLRDAAVPYAAFQLDAGAVDVARTTASVVGPYAEDDFDVALLMARIAAATNDRDLARSYFATARRLAGERWTSPLADEAARLVDGPQGGPVPRTIAGG
jgi:DNA-binding winged helix-turn-helix (wHTH) protein/tetratricopeptide (TPR) repeat protein